MPFPAGLSWKTLSDDAGQTTSRIQSQESALAVRTFRNGWLSTGHAAAFPSMAGSRFQATVDTLHRFEELRYPDSILSNGAMMQFVLHRAHLSGVAPNAPGVPSYLLVLEDIDEFEEAIFKTMNLSPHFFTASLSPKAKEHLLLHNLHGSNW